MHYLIKRNARDFINGARLIDNYLRRTILYMDKCVIRVPVKYLNNPIHVHTLMIY